MFTDWCLLLQYDIRQYSEWACRFQRFFVYMGLDTSAWILAAISVERFFAVCLPHKHKMLRTTSRAWKIVLGIVLIQTVFNSNVFFTYGPQTIVTNNETKVFPCGYSSDSAKEYLKEYHSYLAMAIYCFLPFVVMLTLNILIIVKLRRMQAKLSSGRNCSTTSRSEIKTQSMTRMLLCVTFYFVVITTPSFIFAIFENWYFTSTEITPEKLGRIEVVDAVLTLMLYLNHSINFLLYCVSGRRFRRELRKLLKCGSGKDGHTTGTSDTLVMSRVKSSSPEQEKAKSSTPKTQ